MNFFEALEKVNEEKEKNVKIHSVQEESESGEELFEMEKPELQEDEEKGKTFTSYSKEEVDAKFSELLAKIENIGKVEEKGEE